MPTIPVTDICFTAIATVVAFAMAGRCLLGEPKHYEWPGDERGEPLVRDEEKSE